MSPIPAERTARFVLEANRARPVLAAVRETVAGHTPTCSCVLCVALHHYDHPGEAS